MGVCPHPFLPQEPPFHGPRRPMGRQEPRPHVWPDGGAGRHGGGAEVCLRTCCAQGSMSCVLPESWNGASLTPCPPSPKPSQLLPQIPTRLLPSLPSVSLCLWPPQIRSPNRAATLSDGIEPHKRSSRFTEHLEGPFFRLGGEQAPPPILSQECFITPNECF